MEDDDDERAASRAGVSRITLVVHRCIAVRVRILDAAWTVDLKSSHAAGVEGGGNGQAEEPVCQTMMMKARLVEQGSQG